MDKETYRNLDVLEQVEYINSRTQQGETVTHVARDLKLGDKTIRKKLQAAGYVYSKSKKAYIQATQAQQTPSAPVTEEPPKAEENINAVDTLNPHEIEQIRTLLQHKDALIALLDKPHTPANPTTTLDRKHRKKATYNMDLNLLDALKSFEKGNLSVSDVVNQAVLDYLQRHST